MSKQHTPYRIHSGIPIIVDIQGRKLLQIVDREAAKYVIKAVNNHDRLVEALKSAIASEHLKGTIEESKIKQLLTELKS